MKKLNVQSTQHGTRHLYAQDGKMQEAPLIRLKKLTSHKSSLTKALDKKKN